MTLFKQYLVCSIVLWGSTAHAMKREHAIDAQRAQEAVALLPGLTTFETWSQPEHKTTNFTATEELRKDTLYKRCFSSMLTFEALAALAKPQVFAWTKYVNGQEVEDQITLQYPLAHLARGFILLERENLPEAQDAFRAAESSTHIFRSHEEPIMRAAQFEQLFIQKKYQEAAQALERLQLLAQFYQSFKPLALLQEQKLIDVEYMPLYTAHRCKQVKALLESTQKSSKAQGAKLCQTLVQEYLKSSDTQFKELIKTHGVLSELEELALKGNPTVAYLAVQLEYEKIFEGSLLVDNVDFTQRCQSVLRLSNSCKALSENDAPLLNKYCAFARGVLAFNNGKFDEAACDLLEIVHAKSKNDVVVKMRESACMYLAQIADQGQFDARCFVLGQNLKKSTIKNITQQGITECQELLDLLFIAQDSSVHESSRSILKGVAAQLADAGNAKISFLLSRIHFKEVHADCGKTGLSYQSNEMLLPAFKYAAKARCNELPEAELFTQAIMRYQLAQGYLTAQKNDEAVKPLVQLLEMQELPPAESKLCRNFARFQLERLAKSGALLACKWQIGDFLDNQSNITESLRVIQQLVNGLNAFDFSNKKVEQLKKVLTEYIQFNIFKKIEALCTDESIDTNLRAQACYIVSESLRLEKVLNLPIITGKETAAQDLLTSAIEYGKRACSLVTDKKLAEDYRIALGNMHCALGTHYLEYMGSAQVEEDSVTKCLDCFSQGVRLQNPACMRALAATMLEQRDLQDNLFDVYIAMLEDAYKKGDKAAGAILADHYFDGPAAPFGCRKALKKDIAKAAQYAREIGPEYSQTKRLCAYLEFCRLRELVKIKKIKKPDITKFVNEIANAALEGEARAYDYLAEICVSSIATTNIANNIVQFIDGQMALDVPEAYCAMARILLMETQARYVGKAKKYFMKALELSNKNCGLFEMASFYTFHEKNLLLSCQYTLLMLQQDESLRRVDPDHAFLVSNVLTNLFNFEGDAQTSQQVDLYRKQITELLGKLEIKIEVGEKIIETATQREVIRFTKDFTPDMSIDSNVNSLSEVADQIVRDYCNNEKAIKSFELSAKNGNPFAHYVLSKIFAYKAGQLRDGKPYTDEEFERYSDAMVHATLSCTNGMPCKEYTEHYINVYVKMFEYLEYSIKNIDVDPKDVGNIFEIIRSSTHFNDLSGVVALDRKQELRTLAVNCLQLLADMNYSPAKELLLTLNEKP